MCEGITPCTQARLEPLLDNVKERANGAAMVEVSDLAVKLCCAGCCRGSWFNLLVPQVPLWSFSEKIVGQSTPILDDNHASRWQVVDCDFESFHEAQT